MVNMNRKNTLVKARYLSAKDYLQKKAANVLLPLPHPNQ